MPHDRPALEGDRLVLVGAASEGRDYSGLTPSSVAIGDGSRFVRCDFSGLRTTAGTLGGGYRGSEYIDCVFDRARLVNVVPGVARFVRCSFRDVTIIDFFCVDAEFVECVFSGRLKRAVFDARVPEPDPRLGNGRTRNEYVDNDFSETLFQSVSFLGGVDLGRQRLPTGPEYVYITDVERAITRARRAVDGWPKGNDRNHAEAWLEVLEENYEGGQREELVRRSSLGTTPAAADRLAELLTAAD